MRRFSLLLVAMLTVLLGVTACGGNDSGQPGNTAPTTIDITFKGDTVTPNGDRIQVSAGQPIELVVTADKAGEIHVHSSPEQELPYDQGTSTLTLTAIKTPGVIEVESHTLDKTILQLEVR